MSGSVSEAQDNRVATGSANQQVLWRITYWFKNGIGIGKELFYLHAGVVGFSLLLQGAAAAATWRVGSLGGRRWMCEYCS